VVADEVRKLAERTTVATTEIASLIGAVQTETRNAVGEMEQAIPLVDQGTGLTKATSVTLEAIHSEATDSLSRASELAHATREQASAANEISSHVEGIAQMAEEVSATMKTTAQHAQETQKIGQDLRSMVNYFRVQAS
jgi:methyl-accepting chemotaxis protein